MTEHIEVLTENGFTAFEIEVLIRHAKALHHIAERQCSEEMSDEEVTKVNKREANIEKQILEIVSIRNQRQGDRVAVGFDGDPRGYVVKLHLPDGRYNTWGGKEVGWGIG